MTMNSIVIFTDGACSGNPGPGGWAAVLAFPEGKIKELGGGKDQTTNNEMELLATIKALQAIQARSEAVIVYTDSTYVIRGITQWIWGWRKKDWKNTEGGEVSHRALWEELSRLASVRKGDAKIDWKYSRGHIGTPGNERCDEIAVAFSQKKWISLYEGPLLQYPIAIYDIPEDEGLPEMRQKQEKKPAYSYLSLLGGTVCRHRDWASCERRVKGQSGAKFKKAMAASEEKDILQSWGFSPDTPIKE